MEASIFVQDKGERDFAENWWKVWIVSVMITSFIRYSLSRGDALTCTHRWNVSENFEGYFRRNFENID